GSSLARNCSSTFSSKRRIRSISRRKVRSCSSLSVVFLSTLAMTPAVYVLRVTTVQGSSAPERTRLVRQWRDAQAELPDDWATAQLRLTLADVAAARRAAALLGPAQ